MPHFWIFWKTISIDLGHAILVFHGFPEFLCYPITLLHMFHLGGRGQTLQPQAIFFIFLNWLYANFSSYTANFGGGTVAPAYSPMVPWGGGIEIFQEGPKHHLIHDFDLTNFFRSLTRPASKLDGRAHMCFENIRKKRRGRFFKDSQLFSKYSL